MLPRKHILLIDDDIDDQSFFCEALKEAYPNISCDIADTVPEALAKLTGDGCYNLIFLDLNMPKVDGFEFLELVKATEQYPHIPIIVLSTSSSPRDMARCAQLGVASFYTKGNSFAALLDMMKQVLG